MHVAIVSPYDPRPPVDDTAGRDPTAVRGGVEEALDRAAGGLAARGHDVTLVTSAARASEEVGKDGVRIVRVKRRGVVWRAPIAPLGRAIPRDADVVHVPATYPFVTDLIPWREARRGRACVVDYHFDVHGTSAAMRAAAATHRIAMRRSLRAATRVIVRSMDYARHSRVVADLGEGALDWVPNGVDTHEFPLGRTKTDDILCVGRLVPYKGVDVLVRAMPEIAEASGARLLVAGDGPERARLERLAVSLDAPVDFLGRVPRARLVDLYARSRVTVLPSRNSQEAFGITLLESMAAGTPVVASDLPGVREVAMHGGLVAPPDDPRELAATVIDVHRDPCRWGTPREMRERIEGTYDWRVVSERLEHVLDAAVTGVRRDGRLASRHGAKARREDAA